METAVVRQFLEFFQDYLKLCFSERWPDHDVSPEEIRNAFLISDHIEKCIEKLQKKTVLAEFLDTLNLDQNMPSLAFKNCFDNPPKYILKKIIQSDVNINKIDISFKIFLDLFSEDKLEEYLSTIMMETASCETLLKNVHTEFPKDKIITFKSKLLLSELANCKNADQFVKDMLQDCSQEIMDTLIVCLLNKEVKYTNAVTCIVSSFLSHMLSKDVSNKKFWKLLFNVNDHEIIRLCLYHSDIFKSISKALIDSARLIKENMSAEYFYINLTYSELATVIRKVCQDDNLKLEFLDIVHMNNGDVEFWNNIMKS